MKLSAFLGFTQEKIEFVLKGYELSAEEQEFARIIDELPLWKFIPKPASTGRPPCSRLSLLKSFILKSCLNICENKQFIKIVKGHTNYRKLCGWTEPEEVPSEPTFSRAFNEFSGLNVADRIHEHIIKTALKDQIFMHISRDATAVPAREKSERKIKKKKKTKNKRGRPPKGTQPKKKEQTRLQKQFSQNLDEIMEELPVKCNWGCKINSQGNPDHWRGYKLHADFSDEGIPVSYILTSASVHDSQVSIPLTIMSTNKVTYFYELMDAGYDMSEIKEISKSYNHVPIIKPNKRRSKEKIPLDPASARRYRIRTTAERGFAEAKDNFGIHNSRFRGYAKIKSHIGFAFIVLTMRKIFRHEYRFQNFTQAQENAA